MRSQEDIKARIARLRREIREIRDAIIRNENLSYLDEKIKFRQQEIRGLEYALGLEGWQMTWHRD